MIQKLIQLLARSERVHVARSEAERAAIFRMRYAVYVEELNYPVSGVDSARRQIHTPQDDLPGSTLFYTGRPDSITASLRVCVWPPGRIPREIYQQFSLARLPDIDSRTVCQVSWMMAPRELRGTGRIIALSAGAIEQTVQAHGVELMIASCVPALLPGYLRLGLRPYGGQLFSAAGSMDVPLIGITADLEHARRCGSPWYPTLRRLAARGELPQRDFSALLPALAQGLIETEPAAILAAVQASAARSPFLQELPPATLRQLLRGACIMSVPPAVDLFEAGIVNRDLFLVLEGELAVGEGLAPGRLGPGELFGEDGFFLKSGRRVARVRTTRPCRLLHIRHGLVRRLLARRPADAAAVYKSIAQVVLQRSAGQGSSLPATPTAQSGG